MTTKTTTTVTVAYDDGSSTSTTTRHGKRGWSTRNVAPAIQRQPAVDLGKCLEEISPNLRKYAAQKTHSQFAAIEDMDTYAQDLVQVAVVNITEKFEAGHVNAYWVTLGQWRMDNELKRTYTYFGRIVEESDLTNGNGSDEDTDLDVMLKMVAGDTGNPETILILKESEDMIEDVKAILKPEYAVIVRLLADGYPLPEIAVKLGLSYDAAWKRVSKIRDVFTTAGLTPAYVLA